MKNSETGAFRNEIPRSSSLRYVLAAMGFIAGGAADLSAAGHSSSPDARTLKAERVLERWPKAEKDVFFSGIDAEIAMLAGDESMISRAKLHNLKELLRARIQETGSAYLFSSFRGGERAAQWKSESQARDEFCATYAPLLQRYLSGRIAALHPLATYNSQANPKEDTTEKRIRFEILAELNLQLRIALVGVTGQLENIQTLKEWEESELAGSLFIHWYENVNSREYLGRLAYLLDRIFDPKNEPLLEEYFSWQEEVGYERLELAPRPNKEG